MFLYYEARLLAPSLEVVQVIHHTIFVKTISIFHKFLDAILQFLAKSLPTAKNSLRRRVQHWLIHTSRLFRSSSSSSKSSSSNKSSSMAAAPSSAPAPKLVERSRLNTGLVCYLILILVRNFLVPDTMGQSLKYYKF